jgi:hypothetical protein
MNVCGLFLHLVTCSIGASERLVKHLPCVCFSFLFLFFFWGGGGGGKELLLSYMNIHNVCNTFFLDVAGVPFIYS